MTIYFLKEKNNLPYSKPSKYFVLANTPVKITSDYTKIINLEVLEDVIDSHLSY